MTDMAAPARGTRIPDALQASIDDTLRRAVDEKWAQRIWERDTSVWTSDEKVAALIANRLGWLDLPAHFADEIDALEAFAAEVRDEGLIRAVVAGMGGSSLAPAVLAASLTPAGAGHRRRRARFHGSGRGPRGHGRVRPERHALCHLAPSPARRPSRSPSWPTSGRSRKTVHKHIPHGNPGLHFVAVSDPAPSINHIPHADLTSARRSSTRRTWVDATARCRTWASCRAP